MSDRTVSAGRPPKSAQKLSKQLILDTALPIFRKDGAEAVSFRAVASLLGVTPMAVAYHSGSKKELLADLVDLAFKDLLGSVEGDTAVSRIRYMMRRYYVCAYKNARLLQAILKDPILMSEDLIRVTDEIRQCTRLLNDGDKQDVLLNLLIDYTHGFVLSATSSENNPLREEDYLRSLDWILTRTIVKTG